MIQSVLYFKAASGQQLMQQLCGAKDLLLFFLSDDNSNLRPAVFDLRIQLIRGVRLQKCKHVVFRDFRRVSIIVLK